MNDSWDEMRRAKEDEYFDRQNKDALARLKAEKNRIRNSPITGKPMDQVTIMGVVVDRCVDSGGIWLDAGELEQIVTASEEADRNRGTGFANLFIQTLLGKKR